MCDTHTDFEVVHEQDGERIILVRDDDLGSDLDPRDADHLGVMWCGNHNRYILGDANQSHIPEYGEVDTAFEHYCMEGRGGWRALERYIRMVVGATVVKPLWLTDHTILSISTGSGPGWDTGLLGVIFDTPRTREYTGVPLERVEEALNSEVEEYNSYLMGDVWAAITQRKCTGCDGWIDEDQVWGIIGHEYAQEEAAMIVQNMRELAAS